MGLALHLSDKHFFSWWMVPATAFAAIFALGAYFRRSRWEEQSTSALIAAVILAAPFAGRSGWFWACVVILMLGYWLLMSVVAMQRRGGRRE